MNVIMTGFTLDVFSKNLCILALWVKVASALEQFYPANAEATFVQSTMTHYDF